MPAAILILFTAQNPRHSRFFPPPTAEAWKCEFACGFSVRSRRKFMRKTEKSFAAFVGVTAALILLASSLAYAGEARMLTDEELDQITAARVSIDFEIPKKIDEVNDRISESVAGLGNSEGASGFGAVNVGKAINSQIVTQTNIVVLSGSASATSIRQSNFVKFAAPGK